MCQSFELFESGRWHCKPEKMRLLVGLRELIRARFLGVRSQESCLPRRSLQLDPSLGRVSQVPGCSFRARRPTLPRKVPLELSVIFSLSQVLASFPSRILATFIFSRFEAFIRPVHFRCGSLFRTPEAPADRSPIRLLWRLHV
jgi:hypothetical protein